MPVFGRVLTAMATPMTDDGALDLAGAQRLAVHLVAHGSDGVVVAGTTGESPTLTVPETLDLFRAVIDAVGDRAAVVAGTGRNDTAAAVDLTRRASQLDIDGILAVTGYYNRPQQRGLEAHFRAVAAVTNLPVIVYNVPGRTASEIAPPTLLALAEGVDNVVAVKDSVGDARKTAWLAARRPRGFSIYCGDDWNLLPILAVGGDGIVSVAAHLVGPEIAEIVQTFPTDPVKARDIAYRIAPLCDALFAETSPAPLKAALALLGLPAGPLRLPLVEVEEATRTALRAALLQAGVLPAAAA